MGDENERFEWQDVQDHYGEGRRRGIWLVHRNLRNPAPGSEQYRRAIRRTGLMMAGLVGLVVLGLGLVLTLV